MAKKVLKDIKDIKFITIGEVLLRLSPPNFEKIRMANSYTINYGGAEALSLIHISELRRMWQQVFQIWELTAHSLRLFRITR